MTLKSVKRNSVITLLLISFGGSIIATAAYIVACYVYAPEGDEVLEVPFYFMFIDPFVLTVAIPVTLVSALVAFISSLFTLRYCSLRGAVPIVFGSVIVAIFIFTPAGAIVALAGALGAMFISMLLCRDKFGKPPSLTP